MTRLLLAAAATLALVPPAAFAGPWEAQDEFFSLVRCLRAGDGCRRELADWMARCMRTDSDANRCNSMLAGVVNDARSSPEQWIKRCIDQFGQAKLKLDELLPPDVHRLTPYEIRQSCIQDWNGWNPPSRQVAEDPGYKGQRISPRRTQE